MNRTLPELRALLSLGKSQVLACLPQADIESCGPAVCAFLNSEGGYLLCGIGECGEVLGVEDALHVAHQLEVVLKSRIQPPVLFSVEVQKTDGLQLLVFEVPSGKDIPYAFSNDIYIRQDERTQKADIDTIRDMVLRKHIEPQRWERLLSSELEVEQLSSQACRKLISASRIVEQLKNLGLLQQLQKLSLSHYGRLTNAADILLARDPALRHPQGRVRAVCYSSKTADEYQDLQHFSGPMNEVIEQLFAFVMRNTPSRARFSHGSTQREDIAVYPEAAIREGIVNAFAHRDYGSFSGGIKVEISPSHVEIWNSGELPEGIDADRLDRAHISVLRNPDIAHVLYLLGYMEKLGRGSVLITQSCKEAGLRAPVWRSSKSAGVTLTFFAPEVTPEVAPEVVRLAGLFTGNARRAELQRLLNLSDAEHFRKHYLIPALEQGVIVMTLPDKPTSKNQKYRLTSLGESIRQRLADSPT